MDSIIFDVDGTLWDSTEICAKAWTDAIHRETDLSLTIDAPTLKGLFGRLLPDIASVLFADYPKEEQLRLIELCCQEEHKALLAQCAPLYPALEDTLRQLKEKYRLFIVSNCQAGYIEVFLEASGLGSGLCRRYPRRFQRHQRCRHSVCFRILWIWSGFFS